MKRMLIGAMTMAMLLAAVSAYACGDKSNPGKAEKSAAKAQLSSSSAAGCQSQGEATKADASGSCHSEDGAKAMTTEARKVDGASACPYMNGSYKKGAAMKTDTQGGYGSSAKAAESKKVDASSNCPVRPGCCESKTTKASSASQKAEVTEKKDVNPVLIMSNHVEGSGDQQ